MITSSSIRIISRLAVLLLLAGPIGVLFGQVADDPITVPVGFQGLYNADATGDSENPATISMSPDGTNFASGSSAGGVDQLTSNGVCRLRPGRTYLFTINTYYLTRVRVKVTAPAGYRVFINTVEHEMFDWQMGTPGQHLDAIGHFSVRLDDGSGAAVGEAASLRPGRVLWSVGLGNLRNGKPAGSIVMAENGLTANTYKPDALYYDREGAAADGIGDEGEVETIKVANILRQVYANSALVDITADGDHACYIRYYARDSGLIGSKVNGVYTVSGTPIYEYHVENPTYPALDALRVTKTTNQNGQLVTWTEMRKQTSQPTGQTQWLIQDWVDNTVTTSPVQHRWTYTDSDRSELIEVLNASGTTVNRDLKLYTDINFGSETSRELTSETVGDGATAVTTTYTYYTDPNFPGDWHRIRNISSTDGSWTGFNYCNEFTMRGQVKETRRPHKNAPTSDPGFNPSTGERTTLTYDFVDWAGTQKLPTRIETAIDNTTVSKSEIDYSYETVTDQSADYSSGFSADMSLTVGTRRDYFSASQYLTSVTKVYREDADDQYRFFPGLIYSSKRSDKTMTVNFYFHTAFAGSSYTPLSSGEGRETLVVNGTSDTSLGSLPSYPSAQPVPSNFHIVAGKSSAAAVFYGGLGTVTVIEQSVYATDGQWVATQQDWPTYTDSFYPSQVAHRASYAGVTWVVVNNTWTGGRLTAMVDDTGIRKSITYDAVGRAQTITRDSATGLSSTVPVLTTTNTYDAAGRVTGQIISSVAFGESLTSARTYDTAGRALSETYPGTGTTSYAYDIANRTVTLTLPTGSTRIENMFLDGRTSSVTGTAVVAGYSDFAVAADGTRYTKASALSLSGSRNSESWADWLGRPQTNRQPGFTGQQSMDQLMNYDPVTGQLIRTIRTGYKSVRYEYSSMGEKVRSGLDIDDGGLVAPSSDRLVDSDVSAELYNGDYWLTSRQWAYPTAGDATRKLTDTTRQRLTGLSDTLRGDTRSFDAEGNETRQTITVDSANKLVTATTTRPGFATAQTDVSLNGLPISSTGHDGLTYTRGYDALTRPTTVTDPRTGTVTTVYWPNTSLPQQTTDAAGKRLSYTIYDGAGRPSIMYDALNNTSRVSYNARGQVEYQWGSASYPVSYVYDAFGQRTALHTYQSGDSTTWEAASWPGGSASYSNTNWEFDDPSGLLKKKYDHAGNYVEYTYNMRGQTDQRFWSRTISGVRVSSTYGYDAATGELTSISYNDGTPAVGYVYNRLGQTMTVSDYTGSRTFGYDSSSPWRLTSETLPAFYGSRLLSRTYESATSTNTGDASYTGHTIGTVLGAYSGYRLGTSSTPANDLEVTYATSNAGRLAGQVSRHGNGASSRQFVYGYETNSALLKTLSVVGNAFYVDRGFESNRNLLSRIESRWSTTIRTKFEYAYDDRRQRQSMVQSGDAYADYGDSIHQIFNYDARSELKSAGTYMGGTPTATTSLMKARMHEFDYDSVGNRKTSNTSGVAGLADHYAVNALNQYSSRENNTLSTGGVADPGAKVAVTSTASSLAGRAGRHWGDNAIVGNGSQPFYGSIPVYSGLLGGAPGGKDLFRVESKIGFLAQALQSFTYDTDGNLTSDGVWFYQWDAENRLIHMETTPLANTAGVPNRKLDFRYDCMNRRVQKSVLNGSNNTLLSERRYLYDGSNLIAEFDGSAAIKRSYTWGLDLDGSFSASGGVGALVQIYDHASNKTFFPAYDGNGNIAALLRDDGVLAAAYEYSPFGELLRNERFDSDIADNAFKFSTKFTDDESGLVSYGARYYSPGLGSFINRDPIGEAGGLNLYGFCGNDPINNTDFLGYSFLGNIFKKIGHWISHNWTSIVATALYFLPGGPLLSMAFSAAVGYANGGFTGLAIGLASSMIGGAIAKPLGGGIVGELGLKGFAAAATQGAVAGAITGGVANGISGRSIGDGMLSGLETGAVMGGLSYEIDSHMSAKVKNNMQSGSFGRFATKVDGAFNGIGVWIASSTGLPAWENYLTKGTQTAGAYATGSNGTTQMPSYNVSARSGTAFALTFASSLKFLSPGHEMSLSLAHKPFTSQFPHPPGAHGSMHGKNNLLDLGDTLKEEHNRTPEYAFSIDVRDMDAFEAGAEAEVGKMYWDWDPTKPNETQCSVATYKAFVAGGVPLRGYSSGILMPETLARMLLKLSKDPSSGVRRIDPNNFKK